MGAREKEAMIAGGDRWRYTAHSRGTLRRRAESALDAWVGPIGPASLTGGRPLAFLGPKNALWVAGGLACRQSGSVSAQAIGGAPGDG